MTTADLIRMANQIAANFAAHDEAEVAIAIASHLRQFWEPRMRQDLIAASAEGRAEELSPQVLSALALLQQ